ncbi:MAG: SDR family NAD(P)-dependent oxidoreductase [Isosphaeraceae bacterium]|nr:SDR family NAD(P)-dependent oxidoreductase [Isosphaeraceae bacterium]
MLKPKASHPQSSLVVLLTGAANGIGRATASELAARGFRLGLIDREASPLEDLAAVLSARGAEVGAQVADVRDGGQLTAAVAALETRVGPTDVLVACAGVGGLSTATDLDLDGFQRMLEVNVLGVARTIEAVLPGMFARGRGHIVGISSVAGFRGLPWMPGYSASKAAITTYLEGLRPALKRRGVRITTVFPGFVRTALTADTPFRRPLPMMEPEQAAHYVVRAVVKRPRDYTFPLSTALGMGLLRSLPNALFDLAMDDAGPKALTTDF